MNRRSERAFVNVFIDDDGEDEEDEDGAKRAALCTRTRTAHAPYLMWRKVVEGMNRCDRSSQEISEISRAFHSKLGRAVARHGRQDGRLSGPHARRAFPLSTCGVFGNNLQLSFCHSIAALLIFPWRHCRMASSLYYTGGSWAPKADDASRKGS
eukprot:scaffold1123_cov253-Pinguiococcus_pyrenoidosus.AAC.6